MVSEAIDYALSIVGAPYVWWLYGPAPERSPVWAENGPPPPAEEVIAEGCFSAGVPNLMLRAVSNEIPIVGDDLYDGGCLAYGEYYSDVAEPFDINEDYPEGTLIGRYFTWERTAHGDLGHVAVVLADGYLLQSGADEYGNLGVNADAHITDTHAGYYFEFAVRPWNWLRQEEAAVAASEEAVEASEREARQQQQDEQIQDQQLPDELLRQQYQEDLTRQQQQQDDLARQQSVEDQARQQNLEDQARVQQQQDDLARQQDDLIRQMRDTQVQQQRQEMASMRHRMNMEVIRNINFQERQRQQQDNLYAVQRRYVNVCIAKYGDENCLSNTTSLAVDVEYNLRLNIGSLSPDSVIENPEPFPTELLPRTEEGHWLEVVAASDDFTVAPRRYSLFLPNLGSSWVCKCPPGGEHTCSQPQRRPYLFVPIRTPQSPGSAQLRIGVYYEKNLIQSQLLTAQIADTEQLGPAHKSIIDYTLTTDLSDVSFLPKRTLNILTNQNSDGIHRIIMNGESPGVLACSLTEGQMRDTVNAAREALRNVHFEEYGGQLGGQRQRRNLLDNKNEKNKQGLVKDLQRLAPLGWDLWNCVLSGEPEWWGRLSIPGAIQVSRTAASTFIFPWALLYDIPLESNVQHRTCPLLEDWDHAKTLIDESVRSCPYESQHEHKNILCPFGFWGFKHIIEQPPSMPKGRNLPLMVQVNKDPAELVAGLSLKLDRQLTRKHIQAIKGQHGQFELVECNSLPEIITAMAAPVELVYFYCHGRREELEGTTQLIPYLEVGDNDQFRPSDVTAWRVADWPPQHWQDTSPLVFINACHTAELTPESVINFVDAFTDAYASGVIGTEIALEQGVASEAAEQFFSYFQQNGATVGQALHQMRLHFLVKGNLLGLAYTPYCSTDLKFSGFDHRAS